MALFKITIAQSKASSLEFSMEDSKGNRVNPSSVCFSVSNGKLSTVHVQINEPYSEESISLSPENVELIFNYKDRYVVNHIKETELYIDLGKPKTFEVALDLANTEKEDKLKMHLQL